MIKGDGLMIENKSVYIQMMAKLIMIHSLLFLK